MYEDREQSKVKHLILQRYLLKFALIIGRHWKSITYVDCFSGPWNSQSEDYSDTSFAIALKQLRTAKERLSQEGINVELRAFFIEKDEQAFRQLNDYVNKIDDVEIQAVHSTFENSIESVQAFIRRQGRQTFPFIFIDPTGWTGFALDTIRPLLELKPCEVLINFMTQHIIRFIENKMSRSSFEKMFGSLDFADRLEGKQGDQRVDAAVFGYRDAVSGAGDFSHAGVAAILTPDKDRRHFDLIYLTRNEKGLEVFKQAEKKSMKEMEQTRAQVEQLKREKRTKQKELFKAAEAPESIYFQGLRRHYLYLAKESVVDMLNFHHGRVSYGDAWLRWLQYPFVWEDDLKEWITDAQDIRIEGLAPRERKPKRGKNHYLVLQSSG